MPNGDWRSRYPALRDIVILELDLQDEDCLYDADEVTLEQALRYAHNLEDYFSSLDEEGYADCYDHDDRAVVQAFIRDFANKEATP